MPQAIPFNGPQAATVVGGSRNTTQVEPRITSQTTPLGSGGLLRVVGNGELDQRASADAMAQAALNRPQASTTDLSAFIRGQWTIFRNHRNTASEGGDTISERLLRAQRMFNGRYDPDKLAQIAQFGGSQVYSRLVAVKCRGATSLLRDVYLGPDRPWDIEPQPDPPVPPEIMASIMQLVSTEVQTQSAAGQSVPEAQARIVSALVVEIR